MRFPLGLLIAVALAVVFAPRLQRYLPPGYDPFAPVSVTDPPTLITRFKLRSLARDPSACLAILAQARAAGRIDFTAERTTTGACPLVSPVRVRSFGPVALSSSFLASCPLALSSAMFVAQSALPRAETDLGSPLARIDHLGSYACRNIYSRPDARLSEHAGADALDVAGFRLANGKEITVLRQWRRDDAEGGYLHSVFSQSCGFFGNSLGPDYNSAHAGHFHFGMRGFGICR
ncbi:extensin family protein [Sodalis ligni]|uniref:extensin-like domain-containing protein n=1 Tax=Sodalis ligni TaxID=2697027 RepID=UPI001BDDE345|nr:extensin family protein [Sodalis ligni]